MPFTLFRKNYFSAGSCTDPGLVRSENQDSYCCFGGSGVFAVSDGMGGGEGGGRASRIITGCLQKAALAPLKDPAAAAELIYQANTEIIEYAAKHHLRGMGATVVTLMLSAFRPHEALLFHAGDSRCYRLRKNQLQQLTTDHSVASAMGIPEEQLAKHLRGVLTNAVGIGPNFFLETQEVDLRDRDVFLLCSDGVARQVPETEIRRILAQDLPAEGRAKELVAASLKGGGADNATALVVAFDALPEPTPDVTEEEAACPEHAAWEKEENNDVTPPTE